MLNVMQKITLPYIEDYIEVLGGYVVRNLKMQSPIIRLARYDVQIIDSMASQTSQGIALTDRQADLAYKLVIKYKKQLGQHGIDLGNHEETRSFRVPLRVVDRSRSIKYQDGKIILRFPYESQLIDQIKESGRKFPGSMVFDKIKKAWLMSLTEPRLLWLESLVDKYQFEMSQDVRDLVDQVKKSQLVRYDIELDYFVGGLVIHNAETSLIEYINSHLSGFETSNLIKLVDYSSVLSYTVSARIQKEILETHSPLIKKLLLNKETHAPISVESNIDQIISYAQLTDRFPIYLFDAQDPFDDGLKKQILSRVSEEDILVVDDKKREIDVQGQKFILLKSWNPNWTIRIPLLLTMNAMMAGPRRQQVKQYAEKIVYCTDTVYSQLDRKVLAKYT